MELGPLLPQDGILIGGLVLYLVVAGVSVLLAYLVIKAAVRKGVLEALAEHEERRGLREDPQASRRSH